MDKSEFSIRTDPHKSEPIVLGRGVEKMWVQAFLKGELNGKCEHEKGGNRNSDGWRRCARFESGYSRCDFQGDTRGLQSYRPAPWMGWISRHRSRKRLRQQRQFSNLD